MNFGEIDENNEKKVSLEEIKSFFEAKSVSISEEIVTLIFEEIDSGKNGYISMKEFFEWHEKFEANTLRDWAHEVKYCLITAIESYK